MFTGIIEKPGKIEAVSDQGSSKTFWISSELSKELKVDQSLAHDGVCLTIEEIQGDRYRVTAVAETIAKTNAREWKEGIFVNLERCLQMNARLDGHLVQGHIDAVAVCTGRKEKKGSWEFEFEFPGKFSELVIEKGSVCLNGISLTAFNVKKKKFTVAVIPYTFNHTNIKTLAIQSKVNIEFDVLGKYIKRMLTNRS